MTQITPFTAVPYRGQSREDLVTTVNTWFSEVSGFVSQANALIRDINVAAESSVFSAPDWEAKDYVKHSTVIYTDHKVYIATEAVLATDVPSVSGKWRLTPAEPIIDTYNTLTSAVDMTLLGDYNSVDISMTADYKYVTLPDATTLDVTKKFTIFNNGTKTFGVKDGSGVFKCALESGKRAEFYLTNNTTIAGTWKVSGDYSKYFVNMAYAVNSVLTNYDTSVVWMTSTTFIVTYFAANARKMKLGTVGTNGSITFGAELTISSSSTYIDGAMLYRLTDTTAIVIFKSQDYSYYYLHHITVSGTTLSAGNVLSITEHTDRSFLQIDNYRIMTLAKKTDNYLAARIISVTGTSLTLNTEVTSSGTGTTPILYALYNGTTAQYVAKGLEFNPFIDATIGFSDVTITSINSSSTQNMGYGTLLDAFKIGTDTHILSKSVAPTSEGASAFYTYLSKYVESCRHEVVLNNYFAACLGNYPECIVQTLSNNSVILASRYHGGTLGLKHIVYEVEVVNGGEFKIKPIHTLKAHGVDNTSSLISLQSTKTKLLIGTRNASNYASVQIVEVAQ